LHGATSIYLKEKLLLAVTSSKEEIASNKAEIANLQSLLQSSENTVATLTQNIQNYKSVSELAIANDIAAYKNKEQDLRMHLQQVQLELTKTQAIVKQQETNLNATIDSQRKIIEENMKLFGMCFIKEQKLNSEESCYQRKIDFLQSTIDKFQHPDYLSQYKSIIEHLTKQINELETTIKYNS
jgi:hypothetical protein